MTLVQIANTLTVDTKDVLFATVVAARVIVTMRNGQVIDHCCDNHEEALRALSLIR